MEEAEGWSERWAVRRALFHSASFEDGESGQ